MEQERTKMFVSEKDRNKDLMEDLTYKKIKDLEKEYHKIIEELYEELGKQYVGKWFYKEYKKRENVSYDKDYKILVYIYSIHGRHLSGIEFKDATITRVGYTIDWFSDWKILDKEKTSEEVQKWFDLFHFNEIFEVIT